LGSLDCVPSGAGSLHEIELIWHHELSELSLHP